MWLSESVEEFQFSTLTLQDYLQVSRYKNLKKCRHYPLCDFLIDPVAAK